MAKHTQQLYLNGVPCTAKRELLSCGNARYLRGWVARLEDGSAVLASDVAVNGSPRFKSSKQLAAAIEAAERAYRNRDRSGETTFEV